MAAFVRETQTVYCTRKNEGLKDVDLDIMTEKRMRYYDSKSPRRRIKLTAPRQADLNNRYAWEYFRRLVHFNFGPNDFHLTVTYSDENLPESMDSAMKDARRLVRNAKKYYKSVGVKFEYILVPSYASNKKGEPIRIHFHLIARGGVNRDMLEDLWRSPAKGGRNGSKGEKLGFTNCDRIQTFKSGMAALCYYLKKQKQEGTSRRWYASLGLKKPFKYTPRDDKYSISELKSIIAENADTPNVSFWEKQYPGWTLQDDRTNAYSCISNEFGTHVRVMLRQLTDKEKLERIRSIPIRSIPIRSIPKKKTKSKDVEVE
ncbi:MAG: hypothetical protein HFE63_01425 [Clostridiales bacterium]|nr:hypothetical protein [Clostridiales bacterium]